MLANRISREERVVSWLVSHEAFNQTKPLEYTINEVVQMAEQHDLPSSFGRGKLTRGIDNLESREWVEWRNKKQELFRYKLGILPLWLKGKYISIQEAIDGRQNA